MSIIAQIGEAFRDFVQTAIKPVGGGTAWLGDPTANGDNLGVSLWLYQISVDEFSRNGAGPMVDAPSPVAAGATVRRRSMYPPLGVNLSFLLTPMNYPSDGPIGLNVLDQLLLAIHESPVLSIAKEGFNEQVRMHVVSDNFEERHRLWDTLKDKPYRLSFTCVLRTARLFSSKVIDDAAVLSVAGAKFSDAQRN